MSDPSKLAAHDGGNRRSSQATRLLRDVQEKLAEITAGTSDGLVAGVWGPEDGLCVIALAGEMDMENASEASRTLDVRVGPGPCRLVVELSQLTFIDSSGIAEFVKLTKSLNGEGGELILAAPTPHVARVFEIIQLNEIIAIVDSLEAALDHSAREASLAVPETDVSRSKEGTRAQETA